MKQWRIGGVAKQTGLTVETLRYYEKLGLLSPPLRAAQGYRLFDERHLGELAFIRHCRALGMSLDDITSLQQAQRYLDAGVGLIHRACCHCGWRMVHSIS